MDRVAVRRTGELVTEVEKETQDRGRKVSPRG